MKKKLKYVLYTRVESGLRSTYLKDFCENFFVKKKNSQLNVEKFCCPPIISSEFLFIYLCTEYAREWKYYIKTRMIENAIKNINRYSHTHTHRHVNAYLHVCSDGTTKSSSFSVKRHARRRVTKHATFLAQIYYLQLTIKHFS